MRDPLSPHVVLLTMGMRNWTVRDPLSPHVVLLTMGMRNWTVRDPLSPHVVLLTMGMRNWTVRDPLSPHVVLLTMGMRNWTVRDPPSPHVVLLTMGMRNWTVRDPLSPHVVLLTMGMRNWTVRDPLSPHVVFSNMKPLTHFNTSSALFRHHDMVISWEMCVCVCEYSRAVVHAHTHQSPHSTHWLHTVYQQQRNSNMVNIMSSCSPQAILQSHDDWISRPEGGALDRRLIHYQMEDNVDLREIGVTCDIEISCEGRKDTDSENGRLCPSPFSPSLQWKAANI